MEANPVPQFPDKVRIGTPGTSLAARAETLKSKYGTKGNPPPTSPFSDGIFMITAAEIASLIANENRQDYAIIDLRYETDLGYQYKFNVAESFPCNENKPAPYMKLVEAQIGQSRGKDAWAAFVQQFPFIVDRPLVIFHCVQGKNRSPSLAMGYAHTIARQTVGDKVIQAQKVAVLQGGIREDPRSEQSFNAVLVQR